MTKPTDIRIVSSRFATERIEYRAPIKFGGRVVTEATIVNVTVEVETREGKRATGLGSMPMGNAWAWPSKRLEGAQTQAAMLTLAESAAAAAGKHAGIGHPLEITYDLANDHGELATRATATLAEPESMPALAQLVATSPVEAAIHDAYGRVHGANSYNVLGADFVHADLSERLGPEFAGEYLDRYTLRQPQAKLPLYHLVGALDPLFEGDIRKRLDDGLPETLGEWILADGLTHLKIKLAGDDLIWDVDRVAAIERAAAEAQNSRGCRQWFYSLDFNEKCASVDYVIDFLARLEERAPEALARVQYIEQPTHRDLRANPENRMHAAAQIKPVVIDESLVDYDSLLYARELGYSGVALKACKGQSEALLMGAAAQKYGMFLCVQDLTCVGASFLHSASLAARMPTIAAIEGNGRQYCPAGNAAWTSRYPGMFSIEDGTVRTAELDGQGLGYSID